MTFKWADSVQGVTVPTKVSKDGEGAGTYAPYRKSSDSPLPDINLLLPGTTDSICLLLYDSAVRKPKNRSFVQAQKRFDRKTKQLTKVPSVLCRLQFTGREVGSIESTKNAVIAEVK